MKISIHQPWALNEVGQRDNNEDSIFPAKGNATINNKLFVVCDGVGGADKGEEASALVCQSISSFFASGVPAAADEKIFFEAFEHAQQTIDQHIAENPTAAGMATTLTLLSLTDTGAAIVWCGDSRVYQLRQGEILYRTEDHSFVGELVRNGLITREEAATHPKKNVITRAMQGSKPKEVKPEIYLQPDVQPGDVFFLCTDGVLESVSDEDLEYLFAPDASMENAIQRIHELCLNNSRDNFSCYAVQVANVDGSSVLVDDFQEEEITVQARVIEDTVKPKKESAKTKEKRDSSVMLRVLLLALLLGIAFAIYYFGIRQDGSSDNKVANDTTKKEVDKRPTAEEQLARINGIIEFTEQNTQADSLDSARAILENGVIEKKDKTEFLKQIDDLDSLCSMLAAAENDTLVKDPLKLKKHKEDLKKIIEFEPSSDQLNISKFVEKGEKLLKESESSGKQK
jgi:protein phosphatase